MLAARLTRSQACAGINACHHMQACSNAWQQDSPRVRHVQAVQSVLRAAHIPQVHAAIGAARLQAVLPHVAQRLHRSGLQSSTETLADPGSPLRDQSDQMQAACSPPRHGQEGTALHARLPSLTEEGGPACAGVAQLRLQLLCDWRGTWCTFTAGREGLKLLFVSPSGVRCISPHRPLRKGKLAQCMCPQVTSFKRRLLGSQNS